MKKMKLLSVVAAIVMLASCTTANESTGVWVNKEKMQGKSFSNIFILVMSADLEARSAVENDLAAAASAKGYKTVKSIDVMPPSFKDPKTPAKEDVISKVKESGCDAIFVATLLKKEDDVRYTPGTTAYSPLPYYTWSGNFYGYYNNYYPTVSTPGYYSKEKSYFIQSNLYDVATEEIMWSVQSKIFDPASLKGFSKTYTSELIKKLEKETLFKKK
jgi:hypothetical protein